MSLMSAQSQIGRKTPTKSSYSSLSVVITEKQYFPGHQGCYLSGGNIPFIQHYVVFNNEEFVAAWFTL